MHDHMVTLKHIYTTHLKEITTVALVLAIPDKILILKCYI